MESEKQTTTDLIDEMISLIKERSVFPVNGVDWNMRTAKILNIKRQLGIDVATE